MRRTAPLFALLPLIALPAAAALPTGVGYVGAGVDHENDNDALAFGAIVYAGDAGGRSAIYVVGGDGGLVALYQDTNGCPGVQASAGSCPADTLLLGVPDPVGVPGEGWGTLGQASGDAIAAAGSATNDPLGTVDDAWDATLAQIDSAYDGAWDAIGATWDAILGE